MSSSPLLLLAVGLAIASASSSAHAAGASGSAGRNHTAWELIGRQLDQWAFTEDFTLIVGNATGRMWTYTKGDLTPHSTVETESTSKWPMAMALTGLAADGTFGPKGLDTLASDHLEWWTKDQRDSRWNVSLRTLLSFTSGFGSDEEGSDNVTKSCMDNPLYLGGFMLCAREVYTTTNHSHQVGGSFLYNSAHLQLAGAMAVKASGMDIQKVVKKYLFEAYGFNETKCDEGLPNPQLATCLQTTGHDYAKFLEANLAFRIPNRQIVNESNKDMVASFDGYSMYGDYAFGHFIECFDSAPGFTKACEKAAVHVDPGAFGFYPLIDHHRGYYMEIVAMESGKFYARSGIPEYLRFAIKPLIDATIDCASNPHGDGSDPYHRMCTPDGRVRLREFAHHTPALRGMTIADVNYCGACIVDPTSCTDSLDEPPSAMGQLKARLPLKMRKFTKE